MTELEIKKQKELIDKMSHYQMASLYRFAPAGHPYFDCTNPLSSYFTNRFKQLGGMTSIISKQLGW